MATVLTFSIFRLLVNLTQPLECLQPLSGQQSQDCTWLWDVEKMLLDAKRTCTNIKFLSAIFKEIRTIMEDGQVLSHQSSR